MWAILGPVLGAAAGILGWTIFSKAPKTEVVQFTQDTRMIDANVAALKKIGVGYEVSTDGVNIWIMVVEGDRPRAVQAVIASAKAAGLIPK